MNKNKEIIIDNSNASLTAKAKEAWKNRELVKLFVRRDLVLRYKQTILGPIWLVLSPLLTTVVFTVIFGNFAKLSTQDINPSTLIVPGFLFYMIGTISWEYFSTCVKDISNTFILNANLMGKVFFPRIIMPLATIFSKLITFVIQFLIFIVLLIICSINGSAVFKLGPTILLIPLVIIQMMILSFGIGIALSSFTTKYRDTIILVDFGLRLLQFACPIAYGLTIVPSAFQTLYLLNPMSEIVVTLRYAIFGIGHFSIMQFALGWGITLAIGFIGILLFNRIERNFIDTI